MKRKLKVVVIFVVIIIMSLCITNVSAQAPDDVIGTNDDPQESVSDSLVPGLEVNYNGESADSVQIILLLTLLSLLPSILIMMTSFTRLIIVFSFLRNAMGLQQSPPNQVLIGLAIFMTLFLMSPVFTQINETALEPYGEGTITQEQFIENASRPLKKFMLKNTRPDDLTLFMSMAKMERPQTEDDIDMLVAIPAFITSELRQAFIIGFLIYLPFLVIDMVVASTIMSMGMVMLPPVMISLPFKLLLFIMVDGWGLLIRNLLQSFDLTGF